MLQELETAAHFATSSNYNRATKKELQRWKHELRDPSFLGMAAVADGVSTGDLWQEEEWSEPQIPPWNYWVQLWTQSTRQCPTCICRWPKCATSTTWTGQGPQHYWTQPAKCWSLCLEKGVTAYRVLDTPIICQMELDRSMSKAVMSLYGPYNVDHFASRTNF